MLVRLIILFYVFISTSALHAQVTNVTDSLTSALSEKYLDKVDNKIAALNKSIEKKTLKMLKHLEKQERRIQKKVAAKDSIAAQQLFDIKDRYQSLQQQIKNPLNKTCLKEYIPEFDSLKTSLDFLHQSGSLTSKLPKEWDDKTQKCKQKYRRF